MTSNFCLWTGLATKNFGALYICKLSKIFIKSLQTFQSLGTLTNLIINFFQFCILWYLGYGLDIGAACTHIFTLLFKNYTIDFVFKMLENVESISKPIAQLSLAIFLNCYPSISFLLMFHEYTIAFLYHNTSKQLNYFYWFSDRP